MFLHQVNFVSLSSKLFSLSSKFFSSSKLCFFIKLMVDFLFENIVTWIGNLDGFLCQYGLGKGKLVTRANELSIEDTAHSIRSLPMLQSSHVNKIMFI